MKKKFIEILVVGLIIFSLTSFANATLITSAADPSLSGATLLDFNSEVAGNFSSRTFGNVTFSSLTSGELMAVTNVWGGGAFGNVFGVSGMHLTTFEWTGSSIIDGSGEDFRIDFAQPVSAFAFSWGAEGGPGL